MPATAVVGAQWGDEGKGKIVDLLAERADLVARFSGGNNAGHTIINHLGEFRLHLVPSGIFHPGSVCVIGNGVVIDPAVLLREMDGIAEKGVDISRLYISDRAHVIMPYHILLDQLEEESRGDDAIGTTRKGVGPAFVDKVARAGIRVGDLVDPQRLREKLGPALDQKNKLITRVFGACPLDFAEIYDRYVAYGRRLAPHVTETSTIVHEALARRQKVLLEGAQGTMLDPDAGTYPYVTSSSPTAGNACLGLGIGPTQITEVVGVFKAYTTRVGRGPMPTELLDATGEEIRRIGHEYGTTTGRPRRCGWFDAVVGRFAARLNGCTAAAITRLDILDELASIKICTGYRVAGKTLDHVPSDLRVLEKCEPVYEEFPGWQTSVRAVRHFDDLPTRAKAYLNRLSELIACPIAIVSVGSGREETITCREVI